MLTEKESTTFTKNNLSEVEMSPKVIEKPP